MSDESRRIGDLALRLTEWERAFLADRLLGSLSGDKIHFPMSIPHGSPRPSADTVNARKESGSDFPRKPCLKRRIDY